MVSVAPADARHAPAHPRVPRIRGIGMLTGWGEGVAALRAATAERGTGLVTVPTPVLGGDRFRRATRECLLAVAAAKAAVADAGLSRGGGDRRPRNGYPVRERHRVRRREPGVPRGRDVDDASLPVHVAERGARRGDDRVGRPRPVREPHGRRAGDVCRRSGGRRAGWPRAAPTGCSFSRSRRSTRCGTSSGAPAGSTRGPWWRGRRACSSRPGRGGRLRWASALAGPSGSSRTVTAVLDGVLGGRPAGLRLERGVGSGPGEHARREFWPLAGRRQARPGWARRWHGAAPGPGHGPMARARPHPGS